MKAPVEPFEFVYQRTSTIDFREVFHAHSHQEFTYVHQGKGNLIIEGKTFPIAPGTLLIFQSFQLHRVQIDVTPDSPFVRSLISFDPVIIKPYIELFPSLQHFYQFITQSKRHGDPLYHIKETDPIISLLVQFNKVRAHIPKENLQEEYIFFLLSYLRELSRIEHKPAKYLNTCGKYNHRVEEVINWIEQHYHEPFKLTNLSNELHLSHYYISHLFKEAAGTTVLKYVQATRIRHACILLMRTSLSIPEIGIRVGMPNPSYFCQVFREKMETTPHQYRLQIKKP